MKPMVLRSIAVAASTLLLIGAARVLHDVTICPHYRRGTRVRAQDDRVIRDTGYVFAREGDAIFACTTPHSLGPITWHQDLDCYCAPATMSAAAVGRRLGGECRVDQLTPSRTATTGACRQAHCFEHIDPSSP